MANVKNDFLISNIEYLITSLGDENLINENEKYIIKLVEFSKLSKEKRDLMGFFYSVSYDDDNYIIRAKKSSYPFFVLSDYIPNSKQDTNDIVENIKLVLSKKITAPIMHTVLENGEYLYTIIEYEQDNTQMIINHNYNIIMKKEDYIDLFKPKFIQSLTQGNVARINSIINSGREDINIYYYLLFGNEILKDLSRNFSYLTDKYDETGINNNNFYITFEDPYIIENIDSDENIVDDEIDNFTLTQDNTNKNISYSEQEHQYVYKNKIFFELLSDIKEDGSLKSILLSEERYGFCHYYSKLLLQALSRTYDDIELVSGQIKIAENIYYNHTWIELDDSAIDFTRNLIMKKEDYYDMLHVKVINRTNDDLLERNLELEKLYGIELNSALNGYFSQELNRDLERHKTLLKNNRD